MKALRRCGQAIKITGFTLIELMMVIVVLSILALGTTRYIVQSVESYTVSAERSKLATSGRVSVEKIVRRLRNALPNSVRVSSSGRCIEYFPILAGGATVGTIPIPVSNVSTSPFTLSSAPTNYIVIAALGDGELYLPGLPSLAVIAASGISSGGTYTNISLATPHQFTRTSSTERFFLAGNPERFCVNASGELNLHSSYGIVGTMSDTVPTGTSSSLIAENIDVSVVTPPFNYLGQTLIRNALVEITMHFMKNNDPIRISHEIQIRNVP